MSYLKITIALSSLVTSLLVGCHSGKTIASDLNPNTESTSEHPSIHHSISTPDTPISIIPTSNTQASNTTVQTPTVQENIPSLTTHIVEGNEKSTLFQQILQQQESLGLCQGSEIQNHLDDSTIYSRGDTFFLASVLCHQGAYQGSYEFLQIYVENHQTQITHPGVHLAGFPTMDLEKNILSNSYLANGLGDCIISTDYHWSGYDLKLLRVEPHEDTKAGCQELSVRTPGPDNVITATSAGVAKLGMTLGELRRLLPADAHFEPTSFGYDTPPGLRVRFYDQTLTLAFHSLYTAEDYSQGITDDSTIKLIIVQNPHFMTAEGVGPGTPIAMAVAQYGPATLSYLDRSEDQEKIHFADDPFPETPNSEVKIYTNQETLTEVVGRYPESEGFFKQTQQYHDHGAIGSIWIIDPS